MCRRFRLRRNAVLKFYVDFDCAGSLKLPSQKSQLNSKASFYRVFAYVFGHELHLRGRCKDSVTCGGQKREFTRQVPGIGHVVKIVASAVFRGGCQRVGRRASFEGLRFTWQAQGIRTMDPIF